MGQGVASAVSAPVSGLPGLGAGARLTAGDLAELIGAFNEVTAKLQVSHDQLTSEVSRLRTQLREADEQLQRSRRLAALGEMAAGIAHEIRNPLGSICLYARMLEEDLTGLPRERDVASKIGRAVRGVDAIVTDVLAFAGDSSLRVARVEAAELVESAVEHAGARGGVVRLEIAHAEPGLSVECDECKVRRALVNVIRNGAESIAEAVGAGAPTSGVLRVSTRRVGEGGAELVAFTVRDSGVGLSDTVIERMFNPFFTTREAGTGLGLAIVHRIVDAHGGRVSVRNNGAGAAGGATVEILIPSRRTEAAGAGGTEQQREAQG